MDALRRFTEQLRNCNTNEAIAQVLDQTIRALGYSYNAFSMVPRNQHLLKDKTVPTSIDNYIPAIREYWKKHPDAHEVDPNIVRIIGGADYIEWSLFKEYSTPEQKYYLDLALEHCDVGFIVCHKMGLCVGALSITFDGKYEDFKALYEETAWVLRIITVMLSEKCSCGRLNRPATIFTEKEIEAMEAFAEFPSLEQTALMLGISETSAKDRLSNARDKAGVRSNAELIFLMRSYRLI